MSTWQIAEQDAIDAAVNLERGVREDSIDPFIERIVRAAVGHDVDLYLDVGAGCGRYTRLIAAHRYYVNEPHEATWQAGLGQTDVRRILGDCYGLDVYADTFDMVSCYHVLHHIVDRPRALAEFRRVLRPSGRLLIVEPRHTFRRSLRLLYHWAREYVWTRRQYETHDFFTPRELPALCHKAGLRVINSWIFPGVVGVLAERGPA